MIQSILIFYFHKTHEKLFQRLYKDSLEQNQTTNHPINMIDDHQAQWNKTRLKRYQIPT